MVIPKDRLENEFRDPDWVSRLGLSFNRIQFRVVAGLLTGYNTLRRRLHLMGLSDSPLCRRCGAEDEALASLRQTCPGSSFLDPEDIKSKYSGAIWNFSKVTGLP